jgi:cytochrome c peroxidase
MALAAFERTIQTDTSPYERALREEVALDDDAARGRDLFFSTRLRCGACHGGPRLMTPTDDGVRRVGDDGFANNGLYDVDGTGSYPARDQGVFMHSFDPKDRGLFRIPSLKNVTRTAPYFHDGSASTLDEVLDHYARGGRKIDDGPDPGDGKASPLKSPLVAGFALDDDERAALHAFFESLTDVEALDDPRFAPPSP